MAGKRHRNVFARKMAWAEGSGDGIEYVRFPRDETDKDAPLVVLSRFVPGAEVHAHTHGSNYLEYIIEGEQTVGNVTFGKGDVRIVQGGAGYGPIRIGPDGCTVLIVFQNQSRARMQDLPPPRRPVLAA